MGKIIAGLFLGFLIGVGCRWFDIPLPSPPRLVGVLVVLSITLGYLGMDYLLTRQAKRTGRVMQPLTTAQYCGGPTGSPPSYLQNIPLTVGQYERSERRTAQNHGVPVEPVVRYAPQDTERFS